MSNSRKYYFYAKVTTTVTCLYISSKHTAVERYVEENVKVDFLAYSASSQSLLDSVEKVQKVFRVTATDVWGNGSNLLDKCDVSTVELLLVARLGLEGVFLTTREKFISDMVNKISTVPLSQEECRELVNSLLVTNYTPTLAERWNILHMKRRCGN